MNKNLLLWNGESYFAEKNDAHFTQFLRSWHLKINMHNSWLASNKFQNTRFRDPLYFYELEIPRL